jgi:hypothetical protein
MISIIVLLWLFFICQYSASPGLNRDELLTQYRTQYHTIRKVLVARVQAGGKVTKEENTELHKFKYLARDLAKELQSERTILSLKKAWAANKFIKRVSHIPDKNDLTPPSVKWTESIDMIGLKAAVISFRIIHEDISWINDAFERANSKLSSNSTPSSSTSKSKASAVGEIPLHSYCRATTLMVSTSGDPIDNQHASKSYALAPPYSILHITFKLNNAKWNEKEKEKKEIIKKTFEETCTIITSEGYSQLLCPISTKESCDLLKSNGAHITVVNFLHSSLHSLTINTLKFEAESQDFRESFIDSKDIPKYAVVSHLGTQSRNTVLGLEAWIRFHVAKGFLTVVYDRYGFHRNYVEKENYYSEPYYNISCIREKGKEEGSPCSKPLPVPTTILSLMSKERSTAEKERKQAASTTSSTNWASPLPYNDKKEYKMRREKRNQHRLVYYDMPSLPSQSPDVNFYNSLLSQQYQTIKNQKKNVGKLLYHDYTPIEIVRRTSDKISGGGPSKLFVPYFDKPMSFMHAVHELSPILGKEGRVILLDIDEFFDCSNHFEDILSKTPEYTKYHELRISRRVVSSIISKEECINVEGCTFPDLFGVHFKWQKFNKVAVKPHDVPDVSIHGSETPGWTTFDLPDKYVSTGFMPAWDCTVEHLNPTYFNPKVKTRSIIKSYEPSSFRGPYWWGLRPGQSNYFNGKSVRDIFIPLAAMDAYSHYKPDLIRGSGYNSTTGTMQYANINDLPENVRNDLRKEELNGF